MTPPPKQRLWFLVGATASGKSTVGLEVAARIGAEILSLDSMAIYRGMDIGTAKPSLAERARVPHHLIDLVDPHEAFSTGRYLEAAEAAVADIVARGKLPLFVGGTALYLKGLTEGFVRGPAADWAVRNRLAAEAVEHGTPALHERLRALDPAAAARIHPNDLRRIVRALEVAETLGTPISALQTQFGRPSERFDCTLAGLRRDRKELYARIDRRVDAMFAAGLLDEVRRLLRDPRGISHAASQFVGYGEAIAHLRGELTLDEAHQRVKFRTHQFARRQDTWFKRFAIRWIDATPDSAVGALADAVIRELGMMRDA